MKTPISIQKTQSLLPSEDYTFLRQKGLEFIEKLGSEQWTDYNITDAGITILENIIYAQTELGYRLGFPITDFLADSLNKGGLDQAFFSAAEILTTSPITISDYRRLLIDNVGVRNAWLIAKDCACEMPLFPDCNNSQLVYRFDSTKDGIIPKGMYDILLDFEEDSDFGNLNDGKLFTKYYLDFLKESDLEIRFPIWQEVNNRFEDFEHFLDLSKNIDFIKATVFNANNLLVDNSNFSKSIRQPLYANFEIGFEAISKKLYLLKVPIILFLQKDEDKSLLEISKFKVFLEDKVNGIITLFRKKLKKVQQTISLSKLLLHRFRNLDEDFCNFTEVGIEDIAICADIILSSEADIEKVQAQVYFAIEQYFNPPIRFYSLQEQIEKGIESEEIFNGPFLEHGFIDQKELENSQLKTEIRASDIINLLMDIEGILAVQHFVMTKYDRLGNAILPSQAWKIPIGSQHRPQHYFQRSKLLFFKNELPFLPSNNDEVMATLQQLKSANESYKLYVNENNLPMPTGTVRDFEDYFPIQFQFPMNYGIGFEGLPQEAPALRKAQSKQLKGYLMPFEQILANSFSQIANFDQSFSLDESIGQSVFTQFLDENKFAIKHIEQTNYQLYKLGFDAAKLNKLAETKPGSLQRRNQFLNHLLARFSESFEEYSMLMTEFTTDTDDFFSAKSHSLEKLLKDKIRFLKDYPLLSREKAKAFDYLDQTKVTGLQNIAGMKRKIAHQLGQEMLRNHIKVEIKKLDKVFRIELKLADETGKILLKTAILEEKTSQKANETAQNIINEWIAFITDETKSDTIPLASEFVYQLKNHKNIVVGQSEGFINLATAQNALKATIKWAEEKLKFERFFIVEHLLLRPRFYGQLLLPVCLDSDCESCGEEDPYSFRLTFVMPGWFAKFKNLHFRKYAERVIRTETPAHLLPKICWVGNEIYRGKDETDGIICKILGVIKLHSNEPALDINDPEFIQKDKDRNKAQCKCTDFIFEKYNEAYAEAVFNNEFNDISLAEKNAIFDDFVKPNLICKANLNPTYETPLKNILATYFVPNTCKVQLSDDEDAVIAKHQCFQLNAFHKAQNEWLDANKNSLSNDEPQLHVQIEIYLKTFAIQNNLPFDTAANCLLVRQILGDFGENLRKWLLVNYHQTTTNTQWETQITALIEAALTKFFVINPRFDAIKNIVIEYYTDKANANKKHKKEVFFKHAQLLEIFKNLKSIYPPATLHDCEDADDGNVVRLDNTVVI